MSIYQKVDPKERAAKFEKSAAFLIALIMRNMIKQLNVAIVGGIVPRFSPIALELVTDLVSQKRQPVYVSDELLCSEARMFWNRAMDLAGAYRTLSEDLQKIQDARVAVAERKSRMILLLDFFSAMEGRGLHRYNEGII
jgi:hypothetical protein